VSPRNASEDRWGNRTYEWREDKYHSVTTMLNAIGKPWLTGWAAKMVATYAVQNRTKLDALLEPDSLGTIDEQAAIDWLKGSPYRDAQRAADLGTDIHKAIEAYVLGKPFPKWDLLVAPHMQGFERFLAKYEPNFEFGAAEEEVYNRTQRYAGSLDAIGTIQGRKLLFDWKSGKAVYPEVALQLAAYRYAEFIGAPDGSEIPMPEVDGAVCLHVPRSGDAFLHDVDTSEDVFRMFQFVREVYRWQQQMSKQVLMGEYDPSKYAPTLFEVES
jgi:hypothetical protein